MELVGGGSVINGATVSSFCPKCAKVLLFSVTVTVLHIFAHLISPPSFLWPCFLSRAIFPIDRCQTSEWTHFWILKLFTLQTDEEQSKYISAGAKSLEILWCYRSVLEPNSVKYPSSLRFFKLVGLMSKVVQFYCWWWSKVENWTKDSLFIQQIYCASNGFFLPLLSKEKCSSNNPTKGMP